MLEIERLDRHGRFGRSRLAGLKTLNAALLGDGASDWAHLASGFAQVGLIGRLITNTDMHTGNLSFVPQGMLTLAPTYDWSSCVAVFELKRTRRLRRA